MGLCLEDGEFTQNYKIYEFFFWIWKDVQNQQSCEAIFYESLVFLCVLSVKAMVTFFKYVCRANSFGRQKSYLSLKERADVPTALYKRSNFSKFRVLFCNATHCVCRYHQDLFILAFGKSWLENSPMGRLNEGIYGERTLAKTCMGKMVGLQIMFLWNHDVPGQQEISLEKMHKVVEFDMLF